MPKGSAAALHAPALTVPDALAQALAAVPSCPEVSLPHHHTCPALSSAAVSSPLTVRATKWTPAGMSTGSGAELQGPTSTQGGSTTDSWSVPNSPSSFVPQAQAFPVLSSASL